LNFGKIILIGAVGLFLFIGVSAVVKKSSKKPPVSVATPVAWVPPSKVEPAAASSVPIEQEGTFPSVDRIDGFFSIGPDQFPIVETVVYESNVPWLKGRPAWIADYATHFSTSRHFIARSLNKKPDYYSQKVSTGSRFNVLRKDRNFQFYLLVDLNLKKMGFYYIDLDTNERVLVKTYSVGLGKLGKTPSGSMTPLGRFTLGEKVAVYNKETARAFGTRWLPFDRQIGEATRNPKGLGIHGAPWELDPAKGQYIEKRGVIGQYESDGSIRMASEDIEELFSIVISRPTIVEIVSNFKEARLPGVEVSSPKR